MITLNKHDWSTYSGPICEKHPTIGGLRYNANMTCVMCHKEAQKVKAREKKKAQRQAAMDIDAHIARVEQQLVRVVSIYELDKLRLETELARLRKIKQGQKSLS